MTDNPKEREAFEAWAKHWYTRGELDRHGINGARPNEYRTLHIERMWMAWNARAALAQAQSCVPALNAMAKRRISDAIRSAYDVGYNDARNAGSKSGDGAPGYKGRDIEEDHGGALLSAINAQLAASPQPQPVHDEIAYKEAVNLATALFKKHFAHEEHYASGRIVWGPCDTTAGVISQVDNMVCRLVQPQPVQPSGTILDCDVEPRPLAYSLKDYHHSITDGPLHFTWQDKPHRIVYDLIAAVRFYAQAKPEQPFLNCTCFNETDRMYCTSKGKCSRIVAAAAPQPKD